MPKSKVPCAHCDAKVSSRDSFCPNCKQPTMFASVEERTAWELEQWTKKRKTPEKRVATRASEPHIAKPAARPKRIEQPALAHVPAGTSIKREPTPIAIHPAVAARRAREAAANATSEPVSKETPAAEQRVIVLPETGTKARRKAAPKNAEPVQAARTKEKHAAPKAEAAPKVEAAPKPAVAPKPSAPKKTAASKKAPKPAAKVIEMVSAAVEDQPANGNGNGHSADVSAEQVEILRELLRRVTAIEEKISAPRARRFRLRKR